MEFEPSIRAEPFQFTMQTMFIGMTIFAFLLGLVVLGIRFAQDSEREHACLNNFKQVALGVLQYERTWSSLPPAAYTVDTQGRRMQSWRVSILPYLVSNTVYNKYHPDEPWDGPNNCRLHGEYMPEYRCPADLSELRTATNILAVVGPGTAWPGTTPSCSKNCAKGASQTALVVEVANSGIHWMEPRDLELSSFDPTINGRSGRCLSSNHAGGVNVAMADGSVRCLSPNTSPEVLKAVLMTGKSDDVLSDKPTQNTQPLEP